MARGLDPQFLEDFFDRLLRAAQDRDPQQVAVLCTEDVIFDDAGAERILVGRDSLMELLGTIYGIAAELNLEIVDRFLSLDGKTAAARWRATGLLRDPPGRAAQFETTELYEFRDGLVSRWTFMVRDLNWMGRQWGA